MKRKRRLQKRSCESKVKHKSPKAANIAMKKTLKQNFIFHQMRIYKCKFCGYWHIGRTKKIFYDRFEDLTK